MRGQFGQFIRVATPRVIRTGYWVLWAVGILEVMQAGLGLTLFAHKLPDSSDLHLHYCLVLACGFLDHRLKRLKDTV